MLFSEADQDLFSEELIEESDTIDDEVEVYEAEIVAEEILEENIIDDTNGIKTFLIIQNGVKIIVFQCGQWLLICQMFLKIKSQINIVLLQIIFLQNMDLTFIYLSY